MIQGTSFGDNLIAALPDVIGSTIGNAIGDRLTIGVAQRRAASEFRRIASSAEGRVVLASLGHDPQAVTTKQLLDYLQPALLSGEATPADLAQAKANVTELVTHWGSVAELNGGDMTTVNLAKNDALRLIYAAMFIEMPHFPWTGVVMIVGGENVRAEIERLGDLIRDLRAVEAGFESSMSAPPLSLGVSAEQLQYLQNKIVEGQIGVVTDIGKLALTYYAAGANESAALQMMDVAENDTVLEAFRLQAASDRAWAAGNRQLSMSLGRDAAISLGIHEQTRLQSLLWDDTRVQFAARSMSVFGEVSTNIRVRALGRTIFGPETGAPWLPDFFDPTAAIGAGPWDLGHRIDIATNAFNKMHEWVYAPWAAGQGSAMTAMRSYVGQNHYYGGVDHRPLWVSAGGGKS